jgi:PilZ domain-containing protein
VDEIGDTEGSVSGDAGGGAAAAPPSRSAPRLSYEAVVRLSCAGRRGIHTGFVRDIARGGMFLRLVDPEPPGRRLGFELFLPGWRVPARGVGEVAWSRAGYEGPGRPPGMAIRFVALEARAIEMLAALLPGGEVAQVEVLQPRPLPPVRRDERLATPVARVVEVGAELAADAEWEPSLETLLAESGLAPLSQPSTAEVTLGEGVSDEDGPMIFVPPPPLPVPVLPAGPEVRSFVVEAPPESRSRWSSVRLGSAAAGIAAIAGLATLVVVGAARRDVLPPTADAPPERSAAHAPAAQRPATVAIPAAPTAVDLHGATDSPAPPLGSMQPAPLGAQMPPALDAPAAVEAKSAADARPTAANPATRLTGLSWQPLPSGGTRVAIALDGAFALSRLRASRIGGDAPRLVVRLLGLGAGAPRSPWEPATAEVRRIRAGRHDGDGGAEIHLVLDLASPDVRLTRSEVANGELRLDLVAVPGPDAGVR